MIRSFDKFTSLAAALLLSALLLVSCGKSAGDPWDYSVKPEALELIMPDTSKRVFSGNEWTGKTLAPDADGNFVSQSDIVRVNTIGYHSVGTVVYDSVEKALDGARDYDRTKSAYYKLLTGEDNVWKLAVYKNVEDAEAAGVFGEFYKTDYDMSSAPAYEGEDKIYSYNNAYYGGFKDVTLPASWQTQGFDFPIYTNTIYPWNDGAYGNQKLYAPTIPTVTNPVGFYRYSFDVDKSWIDDGRRVYISFGGVESAYYVYVNGHQVGYSEDSFDAADYDITPYLNADGKGNLLAVQVHRWCDGSYFENQDFLRLAGIFRDVYIYSTTGIRISDYTVVTDLDKSYKDAEIRLSVDISNTTLTDISANELYVDVKLYDADKNELFSNKPLHKAVSKTASGETSAVEFSRKVSSPRLWSDEDPYLYTLVISLYDKNGAYYGSISQQLGFREISFTPTEGTQENENYSQILLNGKPLILKGVDRHDINPETGRYLPRELYEKDVQIMKNLNINAVRTSHYPDDEMFYNMCDKYGILVLGECNVETHYNVSAQDTEIYFSNVVRDRIESHTIAYKNRTCIIIWSMGNETIGGSETFINCISALKQRDPTRPIHFESQGSGGGVDIASTMYSSVQDVEWRGTWENNMPYLMCEYAHAMGNSVGNLYEYWQAFRKYDNILGGFIWDFVDQSIWTEIPGNGYDHYGNGKYLAYGGVWGDNPNSGDFCQNGIISADREIQPEANEVKYVYQSVWFKAKKLSAADKTVSIYNEFRFTDLSEFDFRFELLRNGQVYDSGSFEVSCAPLETVEVEIPYTLNADPDSEFLLTLYACLKEDADWAKAGYEIALEQFEVKAETKKTTVDISEMPILSVSETDGELKIDGENFSVSFNKKKGNIAGYTFGGETLIENGPVPNFTRARLSNDNLWGYPLDNTTVSSAENFDYELSADSKSVTVTTRLKLSANGCYESMTYTVYGSGEISVTCDLELSSEISEIYKFGSIITLSADYENMTYYGRGSADTYCDRKRGAPAAVYYQTVSDSFYPYGKPQDTGNKTDVRYIALTSDQRDTGILIAADGLLEASALHYTIANISNARFTYSLPTNIEHTYLNVDFGSRGTGGASCGPETLDKYKVRNSVRAMTYTYTIIPFDKNSDDIGELAAIWRNR